MKLSRLEEIALLLTSELARQPDVFIPLSEIAGTHGVSQLFLKKIALLLKKYGVITSKEGQNGGYMLSKSPDKISALDVLEAVSGNTRDQKTSDTFMCPLQPSCLPQHIRLLISEAFRRYTSDVTIDQFVKTKKYV